MICLLLQVMTSYQENKQGNRLLECCQLTFHVTFTLIDLEIREVIKLHMHRPLTLTEKMGWYR